MPTGYTVSNPLKGRAGWHLASVKIPADRARRMPSASVWRGRNRPAIAIACGFLLACQSSTPGLRGPDRARRRRLPGPEAERTASEPAPGELSAQLGVRPTEFFNDPLLTDLIRQAAGRQSGAEDPEPGSPDRLQRDPGAAGAFLPFVGSGPARGWTRPATSRRGGRSSDELEYLPGRYFPDPLRNFLLGLNFFWQLDIWRQLRNARDAAIAALPRRHRAAELLRDPPGRGHRRELLRADGARHSGSRTWTRSSRSRSRASRSPRPRCEAGRGTELAVQRFQAEVRKNQSEKLIVRQEIIEAENRINFLAGRFPQPVERTSAGFFDLNIHALSVGVPAQLLQNRPDIRQAERELAAAGLDVKVARAHFFPRLDINGGIGYQAFNPKYLF